MITSFPLCQGSNVYWRISQPVMVPVAQRWRAPCRHTRSQPFTSVTRPVFRVWFGVMLFDLFLSASKVGRHSTLYTIMTKKRVRKSRRKQMSAVGFIRARA